MSHGGMPGGGMGGGMGGGGDLKLAPGQKPDVRRVLGLFRPYRGTLAAVLSLIVLAAAAGVRAVLLQTPGIPLAAGGAERIDRLEQLLPLVRA